jgi:hypothetical protein
VILTLPPPSFLTQNVPFYHSHNSKSSEYIDSPHHVNILTVLTMSIYWQSSPCQYIDSPHHVNLSNRKNGAFVVLTYCSFKLQEVKTQKIILRIIHVAKPSDSSWQIQTYMYCGCHPVKRLGREVFRSRPSTAVLKNVWRYICTLLICLHGLYRENFTILFYLSILTQRFNSHLTKIIAYFSQKDQSANAL